MENVKSNVEKQENNVEKQEVTMIKTTNRAPKNGGLSVPIGEFAKKVRENTGVQGNKKKHTHKYDNRKDVSPKDEKAVANSKTNNPKPKTVKTRHFPKRYSVYIAWGAEDNKSYCTCNISGRVTKEDEKFNGENYISKSGSEGMEFFITDSLEKAICEAEFDIHQIRFYGMSKEDNHFINEFLAKYDWAPEKGLFKKEQGCKA